MSGLVGHAARGLVGLRTLSGFLLCVLTFWFANYAGAYQAPGPLPGLTVLAGTLLFLGTILVFARRIASATPSEFSHGLLETIARYAPFVVLSLIMLNVVAPVVGLVASMMTKLSVLKVALTLVGRLSGQVLFLAFIAAIAVFAAVVLMRLVDRAERRWPAAGRVFSVLERAVIGLSAAYCAWAILLTFNAMLDSGAAVVHRSEVVRVWGVPHTTLWWADVRAWDAQGQVKRIFVFPERDLVTATLLTSGQPVTVAVRPGLFGLPWVERMRLDFERNWEPLVALAPTAAAPRKWLIESLLRDGRWAEAARQTEAYARHHPGDRAFVKRVAGALRDARQTRPATALDRLALSTGPGGTSR